MQLEINSHVIEKPSEDSFTEYAEAGLSSIKLYFEPYESKTKATKKLMKALQKFWDEQTKELRA